MNYKHENRHIVDVLFVLALFGVFAISALMLVLIGANVYQKTVDDMNNNFNSRTAFAYVTEKLRQNDTKDQISIGDFNGVPAIIVSDEASEGTYCTYLYAYNNQLMELFANKELSLGSDPLEAGTAILEVDDFQINQMNDDLYHFYLKAKDQKTMSLYISLHSN